MPRRTPRRANSDTPVGRTARVTGMVATGLVGEVVLAIRGGTEYFNAYPFIPTDEFAVGDLVKVVEYGEPRSVYVSSTEAR